MDKKIWIIGAVIIGGMFFLKGVTATPEEPSEWLLDHHEYDTSTDEWVWYYQGVSPTTGQIISKSIRTAEEIPPL